MSITTMEVWQKYYTALASLVAGGLDSSTQAISFAGNTLLIDVENADPTISNETVFNVGNVLPAWNPCYTPQGGLLSTYTVFLDNITLGGSIDPNLQARINVAQTAYNTNQANFSGPNGVQAQAIAGWKQYQAIDPTVSFTAYVQSQFPLYISAKQALEGAESALQQLLIQAYGAGYEVIADARNHCSSTAGAAAIDMQNPFNMAVKTGSTAPAGSGAPVLPGQTPAAPASALIPSFAPAFALDSGFTAVYQQWQANSAAQKFDAGGTITVTADSGSNDWSNYGWSAAAGGSASFDDFFTVTASGSASSNTQTVNTQSSDFALTVKYTGLASVPINPGQWYDGGIVRTFGNQLLPTAPPFFGEGGAMGLLPTSLIIGFEPTISLRLENSDYSSFKNQFQAQATASVDVGPFSIGSASYSTYSDMSAVSFDDDSSTITIGPVLSTVPLLLGVISTKLQAASAPAEHEEVGDAVLATS